MMLLRFLVMFFNFYHQFFDFFLSPPPINLNKLFSSSMPSGKSIRLTKFSKLSTVKFLILILSAKARRPARFPRLILLTPSIIIFLFSLVKEILSDTMDTATKSKKFRFLLSAFLLAGIIFNQFKNHPGG